MKTFIHATYYDFNTYQSDVYIRFDETIVDLGGMKDFIPQEDDEIIDQQGNLILPGLVCGHTHIYSALARGMILPFNPKNFQEILDQLWWKMDKELDLKMIESSAMIFGVDFLKNGITTVIDHHASGKDIKGSLEVLKHVITDTLGMRGAFAFETSDRFDVDLCIEENMQFLLKHHDQMTRGLFGLHASSSLSDDTLVKVKKVIGDAPIHIHVAESKDDENLSLQLYHKPIIHRLYDHGLLNKGSILAHAIHVNDEELDLISSSGAAVAINFSSNMNNAVGTPDLHRFMDKKIPILIGNDGISQAMTTEYLMAYFQMRHKDQTPNRFGLSQLVEMIQDTYGYASDLFGVSLGRIMKGYQADLLVIPYQPPTPISSSNAMGHLFFGLFSSFKPKDVYVAGKPKVLNYQVPLKWMKRYQISVDDALRLWQTLGVKPYAKNEL